jgi:hypothetical protein
VSWNKEEGNNKVQSEVKNLQKQKYVRGVKNNSALRKVKYYEILVGN